MAKPPSSAVGIDLGRHTIKAVILQRRGSNRVALTHFASRALTEETLTVDSLAANVKALLHDLGGSAKACGVAVSSSDALIRIIEQPNMAPKLLRDALRLNGMSMLNQDCRDLVVDCDLIPSSEPAAAAGAPASGPVRYLVGGLPRTKVLETHEALLKAKVLENVFQLAPIAVLNAFEFSNAETFANGAFLLVEIGHITTTVIVGVKRELVLIRSLEFGGRNFVEELICHGASSFEEILEMLGQEEVLTVENARLCITELVRSISSSIGFFEARREEAISRVFVSGGLAKSPIILKILTEELQLPCEAWDPFAKCEINVSAARKTALAEVLPSMGAAYGVAAEIINGGKN